MGRATRAVLVMVQSARPERLKPKLVAPPGGTAEAIPFPFVVDRSRIAAVNPSTPSRQNRACWGPRRCATQNPGARS
jgi:hypothetical protein